MAAAESLLREEDAFLAVQRQLKELKTTISQLSKKNFVLERDVRFLEQRIALLINHKISIEELADRFEGESLELQGSLRDDMKRQHYSNLFFLLQTVPEYLAKLTRSVSLNQIDGLLEAVMFSVYGNQYEPREEHLLLSMFELALKYEFQEATEFTSLLRANTAITRMMTTYTRRGPGEEYLRNALKEIVVELANRTDSLEINPIKVYEEMIESGEVHSEHTSFSEKMAAAEKHEGVRNRVAEHSRKLEGVATSFLDTIVRSIEDVPYGIRWLCKAIKQLVQQHFPEATEENVTSLIGGFYVLRFLNPSIVTPHAYRLIPHQPRYSARRNMTLVAKILQSVANQSHASAAVKESYMQPFKPFIHAQQARMRTFLNELCDVPDFHSDMELEQYLALCQPEVSIDITLNEIYLIHDLLVTYKHVLAPEPVDHLNEILGDLGPPEARLKRKDDVQLTLPLFSRWDAVPEPGDFANPLPSIGPLKSPRDHSLEGAKQKCKQLLMKLLRLYPQCAEETTLMKALLLAQQSPSRDVQVHAEITLSQVLTAQEQCGLPDDDGHALYQECRALLPKQQSIQERQERELQSLTTVYETVKEHGNYLSEQLDAYREYLEAVRKKVGTKQGISAYRRRSQTPIRVTFTQLEREGVVVEGKGIPASRRDNIYFMILSDTPGTYQVSMHYKGRSKEVLSRTFHLEEVLEMQHLRDPVLQLEDFVVLDARRVLTLLNRTFIKPSTGR
ncbi:uncharacterized protein LOC134196913 [Corticium candelabrum]|uniref:uncharacterized protein LOC134196913 n=1 Tax=Corticium candelabrum TaxID=121492 RepID=UPI002E2725FB|nr:uncharacterized protein LOC134196913 [Corticium candelabrum]